eukprot:TRINITY_DN5060_c0_g1_i1.p1 TRINITY_DN5060_c0_g1~~TRINITY_DN5060_c0_g1_i1.p1  ORF type:complete len:450 (+),score=138.61 TRINITY_DN5060_c0_g1_i1:112-1350(+)
MEEPTAGGSKQTLQDVRAVLDQIDTDQEVVLPVFASSSSTSSSKQGEQPQKKVFDDDDEDATTAEVIVKEAAQKNEARRKAEEEIRKIYSEKTEDDAPKTQQQEPKKPILVIGSTGRTGAEIVRILLQEDIPVRAMVRDTKKAETVFDEVIANVNSVYGKNKETLKASIEVVFGELTHRESLDPVVKGVSGVIFAACGLSYLGFNQTNSPYYVDFDGVRHVVDAMKEHNPDAKLVLISAANITRPMSSTYFFLNSFFGRMLNWKWEGEEYLRKSGLNYTIVRPGGLQVTKQEPQMLIGQGDVFKGKLRREDLALICVEVLKRKTANKTTFEVINSKQQHPGCNGPSRDINALFFGLKSDQELQAPKTPLAPPPSSPAPQAKLPSTIANYEAQNEYLASNSRWKSKPPGESGL